MNAPKLITPMDVISNPVNSKVDINNGKSKGVYSTPSVTTQIQTPDTGGINNQASNFMALSPIIFSSTDLSAIDEFQIVKRCKQQWEHVQHSTLERI